MDAIRGRRSKQAALTVFGWIGMLRKERGATDRAALEVRRVSSASLDEA